jgi:prepilin-type N-terminal cleavage/methylation domain-containing protein
MAGLSRRRWRAGSGFTLVEVVVAMAVLSVVAYTVPTGLMYTLGQARRGFDRAQAAAWVQGELDFLRVQGYGLAAGTRTVPTDGYMSYGDVQEPPVPQGFDRAEIVVQDLQPTLGIPLKSMLVRLYQTPTSPPYTILVTYVANFDYP